MEFGENLVNRFSVGVELNSGFINQFTPPDK